MLKNPFNRFKLCVGGSGEAGFSSGSETGDSSYDSGAGSISSAPGVSTYVGPNVSPNPEATGPLVSAGHYIGSVDGGPGTENVATIYNPTTGEYRANDRYTGSAYVSLGVDNRTQGIPSGYPGNVGYSAPGGASDIYNQINRIGNVNPNIIARAMQQGNQAAIDMYSPTPTSNPRGAAYAMVSEMLAKGQNPDPTLYAKAVGQGYGGQAGIDSLKNIDMMAGRSTVPTHDLSSGMGGVNVPATNFRSDYNTVDAQGNLVGYRSQAMFQNMGSNTYVPIGNYGVQERTDAKLIYSPGGGFIGQQLIPSSQEGFTRLFPMVTFGGGDYSLQSGAFSGKKQTPIVYDQYGMTPLWSKNENALVNDIQKNPQNYSRLGSELYGGGVQLLTGKTLQGEFALGNTTMPGRYARDSMNYALLPGLVSTNTPKQFTGTDKLPNGASSTFATDPVFSMVNANTGVLSPVFPNWTPVVSRVVPYEQPEFILTRGEPVATIYRQAPEPSRLDSDKYQRPGGMALINNPNWDVTKELAGNAMAAANADEMFADYARNPKFITQTWMEPQGYKLTKNPLYGLPQSAVVESIMKTPFISVGKSLPIETNDFWNAGKNTGGSAFVQMGGSPQFTLPNFGQGVAGLTNIVGNTKDFIGGISLPQAPSTGGNQTISDMRGWITNQTPIMTERYNEITNLSKGNVTGGNWTGTQAGYDDISKKINKFTTDNEKFNSTINLYNAMDAQNPTMVSSLPAADKNYLGEALTIGKGFVERNPVLKMLTVGAVTSAGLPSIFGTGTSLGTVELLASNPVGWGITAGLLTTFGLESSGRLGLTGETKDYSVRSFGADVGSFVYNQGRNYQGLWNTRLAQEKNVGYLGPELPAQNRNQNELTYRPPVSELPASKPSTIEIYPNPKPVIEMPAIPRSIIELPQYVPENPFISKNPVSNPNKNQYQNDFYNENPNQNPNKNINDYPIGFPTSFPNPVKTPLENPNENPFKTPVVNPLQPVNPVVTTFPNPFTTTYPNPTMPGKGLPRIDLPRKILLPGWPTMPSFGGGSGHVPGGRSGRVHREVLTYDFGLKSQRKGLLKIGGFGIDSLGKTKTFNKNYEPLLNIKVSDRKPMSTKMNLPTLSLGGMGQSPIKKSAIPTKMNLPTLSFGTVKKSPTKKLTTSTKKKVVDNGLSLPTLSLGGLQKPTTGFALNNLKAISLPSSLPKKKKK